MTYHDLYVMVIIGGVFLVLGVFAFLWSKREEGAWWSTISGSVDVREFLDHSPGRPEPNALRIGSKLCIAVGVVMLLISLGFRLWGMA